MEDSPTTRRQAVDVEGREQARRVLRTRLFLHWLRPERALFGAYAELHAPLTPRGNSVELGCGDGLNAFLRLGGILDPAFDYYAALEGDVAPAAYAAGMDVYDLPVHDFLPVKHAPTRRFREGLDHKERLLKRARALGVFDALRRHDLNQALPYANGSVDYAFSNILYWLDDPHKAVSEIGRVLANDGQAVIEVATTEMREADFIRQFSAWGSDWCRIMDRGRTESYPGLKSRQEWEAFFESAGLSVQKKVNILPRGIFHVWNVGFRPIYPLLRRMAAAISPPERDKIREEWVDTFLELTLPLLLDPETLAAEGREPLRLHYVLTKKER